MNNITPDGRWDLTDVKRIDVPETQIERYTVRKGDLLFNRTNSKELVGKSAVFDRDEPMVFAGYLIRARTNERANPHYIAGYLNSPHGKAVLRHMCKAIIGMANINAQELRGISILVPPRKEQDAYGAFVSRHRDAVARLERAAEETISLFDSLIQRAFAGKL